MNKKCFRVIFSKTLQRLVVTSELAKSEGKSSESRGVFSFPLLSAQLRPLTFSLFCALGFVAFSAQSLAETLIIQADKSAPKNQQPIVLQTANGLPQVNIQTPNDKGLSHNKYSKFDVDTQGAILNNSRTNVQTQQAGWVTGNPYLARGAAKVILNEVNASDPSILKGYVEVAGQKADVIIANPAGIHCEGCGVINADRATLTTGKPKIQDGHLDRFVVEKGKVKIEGKGLDNSRVDYTEILAREVQANAGVWSKKSTQIITGKNTIKRSDSGENLQIIHTNAPLAGEAQPTFALDVGELGGMYAGKIHLIGTEKGVGVRNAGHIGASSENVHIDSQGRIINTGTLNAAQSATLNAAQGIENQGKMETRQGDIRLISQADIQQDGSVVARQGNITKQAKTRLRQQGESVAHGNICYQAQSVEASPASLIAAGVEEKGGERHLNTALSSHIEVTASQQAHLQGRNIASQHIKVEGAELNLNQSHTAGHNISLTATSGNLSANNATLIATEHLVLNTPSTLSTQHSDIKAEQITTTQRTLLSKGGNWVQTGLSPFNLQIAETLDNQEGSFATQGDFILKASGINNRQGRLLAGQTLHIDNGQHKFDSTAGQLMAGQDLISQSGLLLNDQGLIQAKRDMALTSEGHTISNQQTDAEDRGIIAQGNLTVVSSQFDNTQGRVHSGGAAQLRVQQIQNRAGVMQTDQALILNANTVQNDQGKIAAKGEAKLDIQGEFTQRKGQLGAAQLHLNAGALHSTQQSVITADSAQMAIKGEIDHRQSLIHTTQDLTIAGQSLNNQQGQISSQGGAVKVDLQGEWDNQQGNVLAAQDIRVNSGKVNNTQGVIRSEKGAIALSSQQQAFNNHQGKIRAAKGIEIDSGELNSHQGTIHSEGDIRLNTHQQSLINTETLSAEKGIVALGNISLESGAMDNQQGYIASRKALSLTGTDINNTAGLIKACSTLAVKAEQLSNHQGMILTPSVAEIDLKKAFLQQGGQLSTGVLNLSADRLESEQNSQILAQQATFNLSGNLTNRESRIQTVGDLTVTSQRIDNQAGSLASEQGNIALNTTLHPLINLAGNITAREKIEIKSGELSNTEGKIYAGKDIAINTHQHRLQNQQTSAQRGIIAQGNVSLLTADIDNTQGVISAHQVNIQAQGVQNQAGYVQSETDLALNAHHIDNNQGVISALARVGLTVAQAVRQQQGKIGAGEHITLDAESLHSSNQSLLSAGNVTLNLSGQLTNQESEITANETLTATAQAIDNTQGLLLTEKGDLTLTSKQHLANQQGKISAGQDLAITSGDLENTQGRIQSQRNMQLASQGLTNLNGGIVSGSHQTISASALNNQNGTVASLATQTITVANGIDNRLGHIQSADHTHIQSQQLNNTQGHIRSLAGNITLEVGEVLQNSQGNITAKNSATLTANGIENHAGLLYSEQGTLTLNAQHQALNNRQGEISTQNQLVITAGNVINEQGEIFAKNHGQLTAYHLNNQQSGSLTGTGDWTINATQLDNQGGSLRSQGNLTLNVKERLNNQATDKTGSLIESHAHLTINAPEVNNAQTVAQSENPDQGILAHTLTLTANTLNNEQGGIYTQEQTQLNIANRLDNRQGEILSTGNTSIQGEALDIQNSTGKVQANRQLHINSRGLTGDGHLEADVLDIQLQQDFTPQQAIQAKTSLSIATQGNITNAHPLYANDKVTLQARDIVNTVAGRISSALTQITASGTLTNEGLINSISDSDNATTIVKAHHLINQGTGRIYGDHIALEVDTLTNQDSVSPTDNQTVYAPVIAARHRLDIGAREIHNNTHHYLNPEQIGSTLFSLKEMAIGRRLDDQLHATGQGEVLRNNSSVIETLGNLSLNVSHIENNNTHFSVEHVKTGKEVNDITRLTSPNHEKINKTYILPDGNELKEVFTNDLNGDKSTIKDDRHIPMKLLRWESWSRAGKLVYKSDGAEPVVLKPGDTITPDTPLATRNEMLCDFANNKESCNYIPAGQYDKDSPIWAYFGVEAPEEAQPKFPYDDLEKQPWYKKEEWFDEEDNLKRPRYSSRQGTIAYKKWQFYATHIRPFERWENKYRNVLEVVDNGIEAHNKQRLGVLNDKYYLRFWRIHLEKHRKDESKVLTTLPGQILAGGDLDFESQNFINNRSTVIAGQTMDLKGKIQNLDELGLHRITETGNKVYSYEKWRGGVKRYHQRKWKSSGDYQRIIETPFDMGIYKMQEHAGQHTPITQGENRATHSLALSPVALGQNAIAAATSPTLSEHNAILNALSRDNVETAQISPFSPEALNRTFTAEMPTEHNKGIHLTEVVPQNNSAAQATDKQASDLSASYPTRQLERIQLNAEQEVRSITPNLHISANALYRLNPEPNSHYLIETDPDFTHRKQWLSSDYMFNALRYEPNTTQKRLGDGFYEQRLVREQINRLTGRPFLGNHSDFDSQYKALMEAGITFAERFNLRPGVALSPQQVAQLTSDMVWLETQTATLPNGKTAQVLVPKVYALARKGDILGNGTLLSGNRIQQRAGELINHGTVAGRQLVQLNNSGITNTGKISGGVITGNISGDVNNLGGIFSAQSALLLNITGNLRHQSTLHHTNVNQDGYQRQETTLARKALLQVNGEEGVIAVNANNIHLDGADIENHGTGQTQVIAKNRLEQTALSTGFSEKMGQGNHYRNESQQNVVISHIKGKGDVLLKGRDIYTEGSEVDAKGKLSLLAENDIVLGTANTRRSLEEYHHTESGNAFGRSKKTTLDTLEQRRKQGSKLGGDAITLAAGHDILGEHAQIISDNDMNIEAGNNVSFTAATNYHKESHLEQRSKSGAFSGGNLGITFGKKSERHEHDTEGYQQSQARSTLGSVKGNVSIKAGNHAHLSGTEVIVSKELDREILLEGKSTYVGASKDELSAKERHEYKQSGLTLALSSAVTDGAMAVRQSLKRSEQVEDKRLNTLLKVKTANEAYEAVTKAKTLIENLQNAQNATEAMGNSDFKVSVSVGASQSTMTSHTQQKTHQGSELNGGRVIVRATDGNNTIEGGKINARHTELEGDNVNLLSTTDSQTNRTDNKNSGWSVGVFVGKSQGSTGFGVEGSANVGKGYSNSNSQVKNNTEINSDSLVINTKNKTTLKGAVANVDHLTLNSQSLHIESEQDSEKYDSKQTQGGVSGSFTYGSGGSASAQVSQTKAKVDYAQVNQQSGFNIAKSSNIQVAENTHLKGGIINAQGDKSQHKMTTGTLTHENIDNHSEVKIRSVSVGASTEMSKMASYAMASALSALGNMNESERNTTYATISDNIQINITDKEKQQALTGQSEAETLANLNRDTASANDKVEKQDLSKVQSRQEAVQIIAEIGAKRVGDFAQTMGWEEGSPEKTALHGLVGYLAAKVGGGNTAAGALSAMGSEYLNTEIAAYLKENTDLTPDQRNAIQLASAAGIGAAIGASLGGSQAINQSAQQAVTTEQFNRQLHPRALDLIRDNAKEYAKQRGIKEEEAIAELMQEGLRGVSDDAAHLAENHEARAYLNHLQSQAKDNRVFAILDRNSEEYKNSLIDSQHIAKNQDLYNAAKLNKSVMSTSEQLLAKGIRESSTYHEAVGKENVLSVYESVLQAVGTRRNVASALKQEIENDEAQMQAAAHDKAVHQLSNILASSYPNARGLFTLGEVFSQDNAYGKVAVGAIAEGMGTVGVGKTAQRFSPNYSTSGQKHTGDLTVEVPKAISGKDRQVTVSDAPNYGEQQKTNLNVSTGAENAALYPKLKEDLAQRQKAGFEKVIKDFSVKPKDSVLLIPDYREKLAKAKEDLPSKLQKEGNAAIAQVNIEGLELKTLAGHSRINSSQGNFVGKGNTEFQSLELPNKKGDLVDRKNDSEYKILSNLADQLGSNTQAKGQVTIFTERAACPSCLGVAEQFSKRYPNIKVNIFDNNGNLVQPKGTGK